MKLDFSLHPGQMSVFKSRARFKVIAAGRRWGKTRLSAVELLTQGLKSSVRRNGLTRSTQHLEAWYVAPTYDQAKDIMWSLLKRLGEPVIKKTWENDGKILLANGRFLQIKGSDKPDRLRGVGLSHVVLDEYATMKPQTWESILRPTLADVQGTATFIGTPDEWTPKNHFYDLYMAANGLPGWERWEFKTIDNPYIPSEEIAIARATMPLEVFKREFEASFTESSKAIFRHDLQVVPERDVPDGLTYMAVDLGGFYTEAQNRGRSSTGSVDETAIAIVKVCAQGWFVLDIVHGRWDVRETSVRIMSEVRKHRPVMAAIEAGIAKNAVMPYLEDQSRRLGVYPNWHTVTHGGKSKVDRIAWALQGRLEHGRIYFMEGDYIRPLRDQLFDFPGGRHDDMIDALAYVDQIASINYHEDFVQDTWAPVDEAVGL